MRLAVLLAAVALTAACRPAERTPQVSVQAPVQTPVNTPAQISAPERAQETPAACADEIGAPAAARLVERCRMVSPATRPPCNVANPCAMIREHIDWACAKWGPGETRPDECAA